MTVLVLLVGLPGSGKTTLARELEASLPAVRMSPDDELARRGIDPYDDGARERIETAQWVTAQQQLAAGISVVLENGLWLRAHREPYRLGARALGVEIQLRVLHVPVEELWRRLERRNASGAGIVVSREDLLSWAARFEPPTSEELAAYD